MQKVFKNGDSLAVTVPEVYAHELSIQAGSEIEWRKTDQGLLLVSGRNSKKSSQIDPEVAKLIKKISKKYSQTWEELSKV